MASIGIPDIDPATLLTQLDDLSTLAAECIEPFSVAVREALGDASRFNRVILVGDGDSLHASLATELAFTDLAGVRCDPVSSQTFIAYELDGLAPHELASTLIVVVSASGKNDLASDGIRQATAKGVVTFALTGRAGQISEAAERFAILAIPDKVRSPGVRTFSASVLGLLLLAIQLGEARGHHDGVGTAALTAELAQVAALSDRALELVRHHAEQLAGEFEDAPVVLYLGSGPGYGSAFYSSAKLIEVAGCMGVVQDVEQWRHVERFAYPADMPVVVFAPTGRSYDRAMHIAGEALDNNRRVVVIASEDDQRVDKLPGARLLPLPSAAIREAFSPVLLHIGMTAFASFLATRLTRKPFRAELGTTA